MGILGGTHVPPDPWTQNPAKPIGIGKPLSIRISSMYTGASSRALLVTSAVKDPMLDPAGVAALHYYFENVDSHHLLTPSAFEKGSDVIFYTPKMAENSLTISVRLAFDKFNKKLFEKWAGVAARALTLPAFIGGTVAGGPAGGATAQALVQVGAAGGKLAISFFDRVIDGEVDEPFTWTLKLDRAGANDAKAGYVLMTAADASGRLEPAWDDIFNPDEPTPIVIDGKNYEVSGDTGTLVYKGTTDPVKEDWPYVLVFVDGTAYPKLKKWRPAAISASLSAQFLNATEGEDVIDDISDALDAYSDLQLVSRVNELDAEIKEAEGDSKSALEEQRDAVYGSITDAQIKKILEPRVVPAEDEPAADTGSEEKSGEGVALV